MNSHDRLRDGEQRKEVKQELEDLRHNHSGLRALRERGGVEKKSNRGLKT